MTAVGAESNAPGELPSGNAKKVYILPIREEIMPPLVYLVRRGVKEAMQEKADLLVLDMNTPGGRVDTCREIISILNQFKGDTVTYVNKDAFSAGAFIAVATKRIYMAPESVIGAAAPIMLNPGGEGVAQVPETYEKKMNSAVRAMVRTSAEKNGYNVAVIEAMIDKDKGLALTNLAGGQTNVETVARVGEILTLTNTEAEKNYGNPPKRLLSSGTVESLDALLVQLGYTGAGRVNVKPTGAEKLGFWINAISPLLLMIGVVCLYIEFKTPGFGLPGIAGITAFALYFLGGYVAGFSGIEWMMIFVLGLVLVLLELLVFTGTVALGVVGALLMLAAVVMALVDVYPTAPPPMPMPGLPQVPGWPGLTAVANADFTRAFYVLGAAFVGTVVCLLGLRQYLPRTSLYSTLVSASASGVVSLARQEKKRTEILGAEGVALSRLRPGGKAQFEEEILDVITQGEMIERGARVRIIGFSGMDAIVEPVVA